MRHMYGNPAAVAAEIGTQLRGTPAKMRARKFGRVAKLLWPLKTAATLAEIANRTAPSPNYYSPRTAERWISGEFEAPLGIYAEAINEMNRLE